MNPTVLLAAPAGPEVEQVETMLHETGEFLVDRLSRSTTDLLDQAHRTQPDVVVLHEDLGPLPMLDTVRELAARHPHLPVVLGVRQPDASTVRSAMEAGARGVVRLPPAFEELRGRLESALEWAKATRRHWQPDPRGPERGGRVVCLAGSKGGVGCTTLATALALSVVTSTESRVCLVDLDLQAGDVAHQLGFLPHRSVADLAPAAGEVTSRTLDDALFVHPSGLRVLPAPGYGEDGELVDGAVARHTLAALRAYFDVVVVDVGTVTTPATLAAVELADDRLLVATPDVPSLRGARRLVALWDRLDACASNQVRLLVNRVARRNEVQPRFAARVSGLTLADTTVSARFRAIERTVNSALPADLRQAPFARSALALGRELDVIPASRRPSRHGHVPRRRRAGRLQRRVLAEAGSGTVDLVAGTAALCLVGLALVQSVLVALTLVLAGHAADDVARQVALGEDAHAVVPDAVPAGWRDSAEVTAVGGDVRVTLRSPQVLPGPLSELLSVSASSGTDTGTRP